MMVKPSVLCLYLLIQFVRPRVSAEDYARSCSKSGLWSDGVAECWSYLHHASCVLSHSA